MRSKIPEVLLDHKCDLCSLNEHAENVKVHPRYGNKKTKILMVGEAPGCLLPGTPFMTNDGADYIDNEVSTTLFEHNKVQKQLCYSVDNYSTVSIKPRGLIVYTFTRGHKIKLKIHDSNTVEWVDVNDIGSIIESNPAYICIPKIKHKGEAGSLPLSKYGKQDIIINEDIIFILGCFMGNGSIDYESKSVNIPYYGGITLRALQCIDPDAGVREIVCSDSNYIKVRSDVVLSLFDSIFMTNHVLKRMVPRVIFNLQDELILRFLYTWHRTSDPSTASTCSELSAFDAQILGLKCGILLRVDMLEDRSLIWKYTKPNSEDSNFFYQKIEYTEKGKYSGLVYDKTTTYHEYYLPFVVHNSTEDEVGISFVGNAGKQLNTLIVESGIDSDHVGVTNTVRCVPWEDNLTRWKTRAPSDDEAYTCMISYLFKEITSVDPSIIVTLGKTATKFMIGENSIGRCRGKVFDIEIGKKNYPVIPTYHPASILHGQVRNRQDIIRDLRRAWRIANGTERYIEPKTEIVNDTYKAIEVMRSIIDAYEDGDIQYCSYDIESTGFSPWSNELTGIALCMDPSMGYWIPFYHRESHVDVEKVLPTFKELASKVPIVGHGIKFDLLWTIVKLDTGLNIIFDTLLGSYLVYGDTRTHDLGSLTQDFLSFRDYEAELKNIFRKLPVAERNYGNIPLSVLGPYGALDGAGTLGLAPIFMKKVHDEGLDVPWELLRQSIYVFSEIEFNGWRVNTKKLEELQIAYPKRLQHYFKQWTLTRGCRWWLQRRAKDPKFSRKLMPLVDRIDEIDKFSEDELNIIRSNCNPNSTQQMSEIMFNFYRDEVIKESEKTKRPSTNETTVIHAIKDHKRQGNNDAITFHENLWIIRKIGKAISGYLKTIPKFIRPSNEHGKSIIEFKYNLHGTVTGRFSTSDYAIHTTPRKSDIKKLFISSWYEDGGLILDADYSQWEMRIFALLSGEEGMLDAFEQGIDIYKFIGAIIFDKDVDSVTDEERQISKKTCLGLIYGETSRGVAESCAIPLIQAEDVLERFFVKFPGAKWYIEKCHREVNTTGKIRTKLGRIRNFPNALSSNIEKYVRSKIQREAQNSPIQSLAWDITLTGLLCLHGKLKKSRMLTRILGSIHDSIPCDVYPGELLEALQKARLAMSVDVKRVYDWLNIPLKVDFKIGISWGELLDINKWDWDDFMEVEGKERDFHELIKAMNNAYLFDYRIIKSYEFKEEEFILGKAYQGYSKDNSYVVGEIYNITPKKAE